LAGLLISVSGIRGIVGQALTAEVASGYAAAFGTFLKGGKVAMGMDTRRTGPMVKSAAISGLLSVGCDVVDIGICPTPTVEIAVRDGGFAGGIVITASHNPDEYNALKLLGKGGLFLSESQGNKVKEIYENKSPHYANWLKTGTLSDDKGWISKHKQNILNLDIITPKLITDRRLKAVVDCVGGAASVMAGEFFQALGLDTTIINSNITGRFPHPPEPIPENLAELGAAVLRESADIGFAFDPDADRLAVVSEKGIPLGEEFTLALGARFILSKKKGPMAVNLSSSMINDFVAKEAGVKISRTKVGERNVTEKLMSGKCVVGGEGNGGLIYPGLHWGRDGFLAAAVLTQYLAESGKKISELAGELPVYTMLKTKLRVSRRDVDKNSPKILKKLPSGKVDTRDGLKVTGEDWWVQIRASNTEPIARLMVEAASEKQAQELARAAKSVFAKK